MTARGEAEMAAEGGFADQTLPPVSQPTVGLLALTLQGLLDAVPDMARRQEAFLQSIASTLRGRGLEVLVEGPCVARGCVEGAIGRFELRQVDAVLLLHLTYSPSLESAPALGNTPLPLLFLDTTPVYDFTRVSDAVELLYNHGIHAVQDLCNVLERAGRAFHIIAGHWKRAEVVDRIEVHVRGLHTARLFRGLRVGRVGGTFAGMGDITLSDSQLRRGTGLTVVSCPPEDIRAFMPGQGDADVQREVEGDRRTFRFGGTDSLHVESVRVGLAFRRWLEHERLHAFTINPLALHAAGLAPLPFLEASKAMARGVGYAGEGDVTAAALVASFVAAFGAATFTEMFCPDWRRGRVLLSHTAEFNPAVSDGKARLLDRVHAVTGIASTVAVGSLKPGAACLVNLSPVAPEDAAAFRLTVIPGSVERDRPAGSMRNSIRGWFRPRMALEEMLPAYSGLGGTHHQVLVYGDVAEGCRACAQALGWDFREINRAGGRDGIQ